MIKSSVNKWLNSQRKYQSIKVSRKSIASLKSWKLNNKELYHVSKKFFKIIGIKIKTNFYNRNWDQPIIYQKEIGILGIIKNLNSNKYLLQAKLEPGNINKIQISPSVQATKSNYSKVHGGKSIPYLSFFKKKQNFFSLQSEQAFRYFNKLNSNIFVFTKKKIKIEKSFRWFSKKEITSLLNKKNLINMDTLSVFSCFIKKNKIDFPLNNKKNILNWSLNLNKKYYLKTKIINIKSLKDWSISSKAFSHYKNKFFSVIGVNIKTNHREIKHWEQPIIKGSKLSFVGFLVKEFNKTNHFLCRFVLKPGSTTNTYSCTVNTSNLSELKRNNSLTNFQKKILFRYFLNRSKKKIYDNILSDEGGRFYHAQIKYTAYKLKVNENIKLPMNYIWLSYNQMIDLIKKRKIDIEARLLFGILNFKGSI